MIKVYYFIKGEEEGTMHISSEMSEQEYEQFIENMGSAIEIFEIRESYRL